MAKTIFEELGGKCERQGDYLIPCLTVPAEEEQQIGIWGQRHLDYLKQYRKVKPPGVRTGNRAAHLLAHIQRQLVLGRSLEVERTEDMQAKGAPLCKDSVPDVSGRGDGVYKTVAFPEAVGGVQFLAGGLAVFIQRVLHKLVILPLAHILRHILDGRALVVDQVVELHRLIVIKGVGHHLPQGIGTAGAVRVLEYAAGLNDNPVFCPQIAVRIADVFRPVFQGHILIPAGEGLTVAAHLRQAAQQVQKRLVGRVDHVLVVGRHRLGVVSPHGGVVAVGPAVRPVGRMAVEHLGLLVVGDAGSGLELIRSGYPPLVITGSGVVGVNPLGNGLALHQLGGVRAHSVVLHGAGRCAPGR